MVIDSQSERPTRRDTGDGLPVCQDAADGEPTLPSRTRASSPATTARIGQYDIERELGRGGMGSVFLARDPVLQRTVAIKVLSAHLAWDEEFLQRFTREARAAARVRHPNIVTIYEVGQDGDQHYFAMEYVSGQPLDRALADLPDIATDAAARIAGMIPLLRQVATALDVVHSEGLVHRDIKPGNILVTEAQRVVVTDFGIVAGGSGPRLTSIGSLLGTPEYMAPEQVMGDTVGPPADEYALATVCYELLAGKPPFQGAATAVLHAQAFEEPPAITFPGASMTRSIRAVFGRALAKTPEDRYPSATALIDALEDALTLHAPRYTTMLSIRCAACGERRAVDASFCASCGAHAGLGAPGIGRRIRAATLDMVLCLAAGSVFTHLFASHAAFGVKVLVTFLSTVLIGALYTFIGWMLAGRTPGMWLAGIGLLTVHGDQLHPTHAVVRYGLGFVGLPWLVLDEPSRAQALEGWHDRFVGTRVVGPPDRKRR